MFNRMNGYFEKSNGNKYSTLVLTNDSNNKIKKYKEMWNKIWYLMRSITKKLNDYEEKHIKIKFCSDDELPLNKTIKIPVMVLTVTAIFYENKKYYQQVFLDGCLHEL